MRTPAIACYPGQLSQVFLNLLTNAAQAIEGEDRMRIVTRGEPDAVSIQSTPGTGTTFFILLPNVIAGEQTALPAQV